MLTGHRLGVYQVQERIGAGGMGEVYRARDTKLGRDVAIKFLSNELADQAARRRFQREAQMASSLNHPHILTVHDVGEFEGGQYLVTELVDGGTLKDWARREKRGWREILEVLTNVADGLAAAHQAGILHRDIKPENILLTRSGYAKLADFGLAKLHAGTEASHEITRTLTDRHTRPGIIVGTIAYMSPEQALGHPLDTRSDIFSFGVVLYELLAGRRPFPGLSDLEVLHGIVHRAAERLPEDVPASLRTIVEKALAKDPKDRFQSMSEMVVGLREVRQAMAVPSGVGTAQRLSLRRNRVMAVAAVIIAVAVATAVSIVRSRQSTEPRSVEYTPLTNLVDSAVAPAISPDGRMLAFIRGENTFLGPGEVYVKLLPDGEPVQLTHDGTIKMGPTVFSPDGSRIAYSVGTRDTWTVPVLGGTPTRMLVNGAGLTWFDSGGGARRILFSKWLGAGLHMGLFTATESRADERQIYVPADVNTMIHRSFLSPDRQSVLLVEMGANGWLPCRLIPFDGSSSGRLVGPSTSQCTDAAWSPDGEWMYVSANTGTGFHIWRQRFPDGVPEQITSGATQEQGIAFAPDGRSFVTSAGESQSTIWIHDSRGERQITSQGYAYLPSFSADGKRLYHLQRSRANRRFVSGELWVTDLESGQRERLLPDFLIEHYSIAGDGNRIAFVAIDEAGRSPVWIATLDGSTPPRRLVPLDSNRVLFDPKGGVLFVGRDGETLFLYHVQEDGSGLQKVIPTPVVFIYAVSPDGAARALFIGDSVYVYPSDGGAPVLICSGCATAGEENRGVTPPLVSWSPDAAFFYVHAATTRQTYAVPLKPGQLVPSLPASGIASLEAAADLPGARVIPDQRAFIGPSPSVYAFPRVTTHRNVYSIRVP